MAGSCPSDFDILARNNSGHGFGGQAENTTGTNSTKMNMDSAEKVRNKQRLHEDLIRRAREAIDKDTPGGVSATASESQQLRSSAKYIERLIEKSGEAKARIADSLDKAWRIASGATVGDQSKWLGVMTNIYKTFANKDAAMIRQLLSYVGMKGAHSGDNVFVRAYEQIESKSKGRYADLMTFRKSIYDYAERAGLLEKSGLDFEDLLEAAGTYAVARHMPERNAFLLNVRWKQRLEEAVANADRDGVGNVQKYMALIENLRNNLDNATPDAGIVSGGYTNGQARAVMDDFLRATKLSTQEADTLADMLVQWNQRITESRAAEGFVPKEIAENLPPFEFYVPVKTRYENTSGPLNDAAIFNPGKYHAIEGMNEAPVSAYASIKHYAHRAAMEYGTKDFALQGHIIAHMQKHNGRADMGIRSVHYDTLMRQKFYGTPYERRMVDSIMDDAYGAGIVAEVPVINKDGTYAGRTDRYYIYFDRDYTSDLTGVTGYELQQALTRSSKAAATIEPIAALTGKYGQLFTRFTPFFGPVNLVRDVGERLVHIAGRSWVDDAGKTIQGSDVLSAYLGNISRSSKVVFKAITGKLDETSELGMMWRDYVSQGLHMQYTPGQEFKQLSFEEILAGGHSARGSIRKMLDKNDMRGVSNALGRLGKYKDAALATLDKWNDLYNNIASFSQFMTLREAGLSKEAAGHAVLDLLNLRQHGTITPFLRMMFPFVNVTSQSAASIMRTLGLAPDAKGQFHVNKHGVAAMVGGYVAASVLYEVAREALGRDPESGAYIMDGMSLGDLSRFLPIAAGDGTGEFFKLQLPLGAMNILSTLAISTARLERGIMSPEDMAFETIASLARNLTPNDWPAFSASQDPAAFLTKAFTPTLIKPVVDLAINKNFMGQPITYAPSDGYEPKAAQGRLSTEQGYHRWAMAVNNMTGFDLAPEQWKHIHSNLEIGPLRLLRALTASDESELKVKDPDNPSTREILGPFLSALGGSMFYGRAHYTNQAMYYRSLGELRERIRDEGIKITSKEYGSDAAKREAYQKKVLRAAGWTPDEIAVFMLMDNAEKQRRKIDEDVREKAGPLLIGVDNTDAIRALFYDAGRKKTALYSEVNRQLQ